MSETTAARKPRVLLIYRVMIPSIRLCGHAQMEALAAQGVVEYRAVQEMRLKSSDMDWADIVLLGRLDSWYERRLTRLLKESGRYLAYILDDDLLNIPMHVSSAGYYAQKDIQRNIRDMIGMSDAIISPSPRLLDRYARDGRAAIRIEEPAISPVAYEPHEPDAPVKIGFAGSVDRAGNLEGVLEAALTKVKAAHGERVAFEFFGAIPAFASRLGAACIPYCDSYDQYRRRLNEAAWDIGLAPMDDSEFSACKHYNKFCEYAAASIAGVYSERLPYTEIPNSRAVARYCSDDPEDWFEALNALILNRETREALRKRCCEQAKGPLSVSSCAEGLWRDLSACAETDRLRLRIAKPLLWMKGVNIYRRGLSFVRRRKLSAPLVAFKKLAAAIRGQL